jgi:hypothetical protein
MKERWLTVLDIIDGWATVDDITQMPTTQLCSYCYGAKLRMMQQSPYSAYDEIYEERLKYLVKSMFNQSGILSQVARFSRSPRNSQSAEPHKHPRLQIRAVS